MDILFEMNKLIDSYTSYLNYTQEKLNDIKILINENDDFKDKDNLYKKLFMLFNSMPRAPINFISELIKENIYDSCNHEWIEDSIDLTPEKSQNIIYCKYCNMSQKT